MCDFPYERHFSSKSDLSFPSNALCVLWGTSAPTLQPKICKRPALGLKPFGSSSGRLVHSGRATLVPASQTVKKHPVQKLSSSPALVSNVRMSVLLSVSSAWPSYSLEACTEWSMSLNTLGLKDFRDLDSYSSTIQHNRLSASGLQLHPTNLTIQQLAASPFSFRWKAFIWPDTSPMKVTEYLSPRIDSIVITATSV